MQFLIIIFNKDVATVLGTITQLLEEMLNIYSNYTHYTHVEFIINFSQFQNLLPVVYPHFKFEMLNIAPGNGVTVPNSLC